MKTMAMFVAIFALCFFIMSCDNGKKEFLRIQQTSTIQAYEEFIQMYPKSKFTQEAKEKLDSLRYETLVSEDSLDAYKDFLAKYPDSKFASNIKEKIQEFNFMAATSKNTIDAYEEFIKNYSNSKYIDVAKGKLDSLRYETVKSKDSITAYQEFLDKFPESSFVINAKDRINKLRTEPVIGIGSCSIYSSDELEEEILAINAGEHVSAIKALTEKVKIKTKSGTIGWVRRCVLCSQEEYTRRMKASEIPDEINCIRFEGDNIILYCGTFVIRNSEIVLDEPGHAIWMDSSAKGKVFNDLTGDPFVLYLYRDDGSIAKLPIWQSDL